MQGWYKPGIPAYCVTFAFLLHIAYRAFPALAVKCWLAYPNYLPLFKLHTEEIPTSAKYCPNSVLVVSEYMAVFPLMAGSLAGAVHEDGWRPRGSALVHMATAIAKGLAAIHSHAIIHRSGFCSPSIPSHLPRYVVAPPKMTGRNRQETASESPRFLHAPHVFNQARLSLCYSLQTKMRWQLS